MTIVVIIVVVVVLRRRNNKLKPPPDGYFPEPNMYGDTLINGATVPKRYNVVDDGEQLSRNNPLFREMEMGEVDNPLYRQSKEEELVASTPSHKLDTVDEDDQEEQEDPLYDTVDESSNLV